MKKTSNSEKIKLLGVCLISVFFSLQTIAQCGMVSEEKVVSLSHFDNDTDYSVKDFDQGCINSGEKNHKNTGENAKFENKFRVFTTKSKGNNKVFEDSKGQLWFYCNNNFKPSNLVVYDGKNMVTHKKIKKVKVNLVSSITEQNNKVIVGTQMGLLENNDGDWKLYGNKDGLENIVVTYMTPFTDGSTLIFSQLLFKRSICSFNDGTFKDVSLAGYNNKTITSSCIDENHNLWVGTAGKGVLTFDGNTWTDYGKETKVKNVRSIAMDSKGTIWFSGMEGKFSKYENGKFTDFSHGGGYFNGLTSNVVFSSGLLIHLTIVGSLGLAFTPVPALIYGGLSVASGFIAPDQTSHGKIVIDQNDNAWVLARKKGVLFCNGSDYQTVEEKFNSPKTKKVSDIIVSKDGKIWMTDSKGKVYCYDNNNWTTYTAKDGVPQNPVLIYEDSKGNIWVSGKKSISVLEIK